MHRLFVFAALFLGYAACLLSKRSAGYWSGPLLHAVGPDQAKGSSQQGIFSSSFESASGLSKLLNGPVVDAFSGSMLFSGALGVAGLCHFLIALLGRSAAVPASLRTPGILSMAWALNGFTQGFAWPSLAKLFMRWFPDPKERGFWYSLLATSQNAGAALAPFLLLAASRGSLIYLGLPGGWEGSLLLPGFVLIE
jgi:MFS transporter, OPA family, sugar phosphate sensor protein UhpC